MSDLREVARRRLEKLIADAHPNLPRPYEIEQYGLDLMKAALGPADEGMIDSAVRKEEWYATWIERYQSVWNAMAEVRRKSLDADETVRRGK